MSRFRHDSHPPGNDSSSNLLRAAGAAVTSSLLLALAASLPVVLLDLAISSTGRAEGLPGPAAVILAVGLAWGAAGIGAVAQAPFLAAGRRVLAAVGAGTCARGAAGLLAGIPVAAGAWAVASPALSRLDDPDLRSVVALALVAGSTLAGGLAAAAGVALAGRGVRRRGTERSWALALGAILAVLALAAWVVLWLRFRRDFPAAAWFAAMCAFGFLELLLLALWAAWPRVEHLRAALVGDRLARAVLWAVPVVFLVLGEAAARVDPGASFALAGRPGLAGTLLTATRGAVDFDGDGASPILGGGDCDDRDPFLYPSAQDEPGNGIDEDCDGIDASAATAGASPYAVENPEPKDWNVIIICIDALRGDHVSFGGYARKTTPRLDRLARRAWYFDQAIAPSSTTRETVPALLAGRYPTGIPWVKGGKIWQIGADQKLLTDFVKARGYQTFAVVDEWLKRFLPSFARSFDLFEVAYGDKKWKEVGQNAAPFSVFRSIEVLNARDKTRPFLLYVHMEAPHHPYSRHEGFSNFGSQPVDLYDGEIAYADYHLGYLVDYLAHAGLLDDSIVVVFGDHGEEFNEHGGSQHSRTVYQESVHVPLVMRVPPGDPVRVRDRVSLVDVVPTILDLLGLRPPGADLQGFSLLRWVEKRPDLPVRPIFSELLVTHEGPPKFRKAVILGNDKLVWDMTADQVELYDLKTDPGEKRPVANPARTEELLGILKAFVATGQHR